MARIEKNHLNELDQAKDLQMKLQTQLKEAQATCNQVQKSLAVVVNERDLLRKEVTDLKAVSDELMAIVEENGLG
jgi:septal ring factor EnvC (AmiA/AmiB activator)